MRAVVYPYHVTVAAPTHKYGADKREPQRRVGEPAPGLSVRSVTIRRENVTGRVVNVAAAAVGVERGDDQYW